MTMHAVGVAPAHSKQPSHQIRPHRQSKADIFDNSKSDRSHIAAITRDLAAMVAARLRSDALQAISDADAGLRLVNESYKTVIQIDIREIGTGTSEHRNPETSALVDLVTEFAALKETHPEAYCAARDSVRMIGDPEYWNEVLG